VRIDALDQSLAASPFRWAKRARAGCSLWLSSPEKDTFEGWHDGYMRLDDPVKHRRLVALDKAARRIVVEDTLEMGEEHDVEVFFHFSEHCRVEAAGERFIASQDGQEVEITLPRAEGSSARVWQGNLAPLRGWRSRAFDVRVAAPVIVWQARLCGPVRLCSEIAIS
jgi:heparinase II/III-like protein